MAYQRYIGRGYTAGNVTPVSNVAVSLGQPQKRWKELYVDANSIHLGNVSLSVGKTGEVEFMKTNKLGQPVTSIDVANVHASIDAGGVLSFYSANTTGNVRIARNLAVGFVNNEVPGANLDVNGNAYISGVTTIAGALTLGTDLAVAQGGTGASSFTDGYVLLGSGTSAITALDVTAKGSILAGDGSTDPQALAVGTNDQVLIAASGETTGLKWGASPATVSDRSITQAKLAENSVGGSKVRANVLTGGQIIGSVVGFQSNVTGNVSVTRSLAIGYTDGRVPQANLEVKGNAHITGATTIAGALTLGTDLAVAQGGTGASSFTDGYVLLGSGTGAITALNVTVKGSVLAGDGSTDPVALAVGTNDQVLTADSGEASGLKWAAPSTSIANRSITQAKLAENSVGGSKVRANVLTGGQIIGSVVGFQSNVTGNVSVSRSLAVGYVDGRVPQANLEVKGNAHITGATTIAGALTLGTDLAVAQGGTGASTFTDGGVLLGSGTGAITALAVLTDGQMIVGDGTTDPVAESGATLRTSVGVGTGDNVEFTNVTSTGVILAADGAVASPSITNTGDTNTGIWYPGADTIATSVGGREAVRITGSARGGLIDSNVTISSNVVNHKGLATANYTEYANNITNAGSSFTVSTGTNIARYTLNVATCAITLPAGQPIQPGTMKTIILFLKQDGTGGRVVNFAAPSGETLEWNNSASEPEAVTGASKVSIYTFMKFHGDTRWYCSQSFIEN
jgi:hypothetical protein